MESLSLYYRYVYTFRYVYIYVYIYVGIKKTNPSSLAPNPNLPQTGGISFPWFHVSFLVSTKKSRYNDFATFEGHFQTIFQDLGTGGFGYMGHVAQLCHMDMGSGMVGWMWLVGCGET